MKNSIKAITLSIVITLIVTVGINTNVIQSHQLKSNLPISAMTTNDDPKPPGS